MRERTETKARKDKLAFTPTTEYFPTLPADFLGWSKVFTTASRSPLEVHDAIYRGFPSETVLELIKRIKVIGEKDLVEKALGLSLRTTQRHKASPGKVLSTEQSSRIWKFAEILSKAVTVLGSQEEAERWLSQPAMALEQKRPIDLLSTSAGVELVEDLLTRMEYGVYT
jgi:putative toxin-antitoxin system antitoxin component (TIGR02293 family)